MGEAPARHPHHPPGAYEQGAALDAFYLAQPSPYQGRQHQRVGNAGTPLTLEGVTWALVSWHYAQPWRYPQDNLVTHVQHCKSFFHYTKEPA